MDIKDKAGYALLEMGITPKFYGFEDITDAVALIDGGFNGGITALYAKLSDYESWKNTERNIRHVIEVLDTKSEAFEKYVGSSIIKAGHKRPATADFLHAFAFRLKRSEVNGGR